MAFVYVPTPVVQDVKDPVYANADGTAIDCNVLFQGNTDYLPFTATSYDPEPYGVALYNQLQAGQWGPISPYVPPPPPPPTEFALISPNDKIYDNNYTPPVVLGYRIVAVSTTQTTVPAPLYWVTCPTYVTPNGYYYDGYGGFIATPVGVS